MNRKEMIEEIAKQSGCTKRLVRKKLFSRSAEFKHRYKQYRFNDAFLNRATNWLDKNELERAWRNGDREIRPWETPNTFEVIFLPSGCVVLFAIEHICSDGFVATDEIGARLYSW